MALSWVGNMDSDIPDKELGDELLARWNQSLGFIRALEDIRHNATIGISDKKTREDVIQSFFSLIDFAHDMALMEHRETVERMHKRSQETLEQYDHVFDEIDRFYNLTDA